MMGRMAGKKRIGIILLLAMYMVSLFRVSVRAAQEPEFQLNIDSLNLQKGVSTTIVISLVNANDAQIASIDGMEGFDVLSKSQSSSTTIIGNNATYKLDVYYVIMPKEAGEFILRANIKYNGQNYETNAIHVTVSNAADNENKTSPDLFVKTKLSHDEAYLGEKIVLTYELYSRVNIESCGFTDYTSIDNVVSKEVPYDNLKTESVYIDGNRYEMYEIKQLIIDPIKSGVCTIPSFNIQVNVLSENSGFGGGFPGFGGMFQTTTPMYLQTEENELFIKSLPTEGKPDNFTGIVGELKLNAHYSREEMNYGDSFTLLVEVSGSCNLDGVKNIFGNDISGFTIYETQKDMTESIVDNQYFVHKEFEIIMIPEKTGALEVASVPIPYFNPVTGNYETAYISGTTIKVSGEMPQMNSNDTVQSADIERVVIHQVNYADMEDGYITIQMKKNGIYTALAVIIVLIVLAAVGLLAASNKKNQDPTLKNIYKQLLNAKDINEIYNYFNAMMKHCYKINLKANSKKTVISSLNDADLAILVVEIMDYVESEEARHKKGYIYLKDKIKDLYMAKLLKA